jgi:Bacterial PH domain
MAVPTPPPAAGPPSLPAVFRPRRARIVSLTLAAVVLALLTVVALVLPGGPRGFHTPDRIGVFAVGVVVAGALWVMARPRLVAEDRGLTVVNLLRTRFLEWPEVIRVGFRRGDPWVLLDLADGETLAVMAIQANDGERAVQSVRALRALVVAQSSTDQND